MKTPLGAPPASLACQQTAEAMIYEGLTRSCRDFTLFSPLVLLYLELGVLV